MTCSLLAHIQQIFRIQLSSDRVVHLYTFYRVSWQELLMFIASKYPCIVMSDLVRPMSNLSAIWSQFNRDKWHGLNSHHSPGSATRTPIKHAVISLPNKSGPTCHHLEIDDWDYRMCVCVFLYKCEVIFKPLCEQSCNIRKLLAHSTDTPHKHRSVWILWRVCCDCNAHYLCVVFLHRLCQNCDWSTSLPLTEPHTLCVQTQQSGVGWRSNENMSLCADLCIWMRASYFLIQL